MEFEVLIIFFITAIIGGIVSTAPPGPLNIRLLIFYLKKEKSELLAFQFGIIITDIICCFIAILIAQKTSETDFILSLGKKYFLILQVLFITMVFIMGIRYILSAKKNLPENKEEIYKLEKEKNNHGKLTQYFFEGVVGTLTIPSLIPFWYLWWMGQNFSYKPPGYLIAISIALGVYFGDLLTFKTYRFLAGRLHNKTLRISIAQIEVWAGYLLLLFATFLLIKIFLS